MDRSRLLPTAILLLILLLACGAWYLVVHQSSPSLFRRKPSSANSKAADSLPASTNSPAAQATTAAAALSVSSSTIDDIQFIPGEEIATVGFSDRHGDFGTDTKYQFYRVGRFVRGPDLGADLLMASVSQLAEPCKGACGQPVIVRYIEKDKVIFPLPHISDPQAPPETVGRGSAVDARPFTALGATLGRSSDFSPPVLGYPPTIVAGARAVLQWAGEGVGVLDKAALELVLHDPVYGDIWMTKPGLGPQKAFYDRCEDVNASTHSSEAGCEGSPPYRDNAFYFFRPDGTYLRYLYKPDFNPEDYRQLMWNDGSLPDEASYQDMTLVGCSWHRADAISVVSPALVSPSDLEPLGKVKGTGDILYSLKDKNHPLYKEFYDHYRSSFPTWASELQNEQNEQTAKLASYEDFIKAQPLFLWKDPFGRLIRFVNTRFIVPNACEPIIYLYPPQKENIQVELREDVAVVHSFPPYDNGWFVSAQPDGELTELRSSRKVPYLFWEGHSYILLPEATGFVVKAADVSSFLEEILPKLGLNAKEASDFTKAWSSKLNQSPYYFISFLDRSVIDRVYPLRIDPPPETIIRVLMDFRPLSEPMPVEPPTLRPPAERRGFTVVEWGVLVR